VKYFSIYVLWITLFCPAVYAGVSVSKETKKILTLEVVNKYIMGDADSRLDAKRIAMTEAKRIASEYAGTYIESETVVQDFEVTLDEIKTYTSANMRADKISDKFSQTKSGLQKYILKVRVKVDKKSLVSGIKRMMKSQEERDKIQLIIDENRRLHSQLAGLNSKIRSAGRKNDAELSDKLYKERASVLNKVTGHFNKLSKDIDGLSKQIQNNQKQIILTLKNVKKETSDDPRKELKNRGVNWTRKAFNDALSEQDVETIKLFIKGADKGLPFYRGGGKFCSSLYGMNVNDAKDILGMIFDKGIDINKSFYHDEQRMLYCTLYQDQKELTKFLLLKGAKPHLLTSLVVYITEGKMTYGNKNMLHDWISIIKDKNSVLKNIEILIKNEKAGIKKEEERYSLCMIKDKQDWAKRCKNSDWYRYKGNRKPTKRERSQCVKKHAEGSHCGIGKPMFYAGDKNILHANYVRSLIN